MIIDFTIAAAEGLTVEWSTDGNAWTAGRTGSAVAGDILIRLTNADGVKKTVTKTLAADGDELDASDATFGWPEYLGEAIDSDTYGINNADELVLFQKGVAANLATAGITFRQTADIDMTGVSAFAGIATYDENGKGATVFEGTYDGSGKTISNVQLKAAAYTALFNQVSGTVKNLTVQNVSYAEGATFGGAMVVCNLVGGTVENVTTKGAFGTAERPLTHCAAGVVCRAGAGVIRACTNQAAVVGSYTKVAGILAVQQSKTGVVDADGNAALLVESCSNEGSVTAMSGADAGRDGIGGIFAYPMNDNAATIKDCANTGAVVAGENCSTSAKAGQIVGYYYTDVAFDGVNKGTTDALMIGAYNNNDSGYNFATVDGTVATLVADSDMVAGGSYMVVAAGGKPVIELAKEESISFDTSLADIDATGITAVDGCRIEAIAEGLSITYTALVPGSEKLPWKIGPEGYEAEVVAWTNGMGTLVINGTGAVKSTPWDENSAGITRLQVAEDVTALDGTIETLPDSGSSTGCRSARSTVRRSAR